MEKNAICIFDRNVLVSYGRRNRYGRFQIRPIAERDKSNYSFETNKYHRDKANHSNEHYGMRRRTYPEDRIVEDRSRQNLRRREDNRPRRNYDDRNYDGKNYDDASTED